MVVCQDNHLPIVFDERESHNCPLCIALSNLRDAVIELASANAEVHELQGEITHLINRFDMIGGFC